MVIFIFRVCPDNRPEVVVVDLLLILVHPVAPFFLAQLALHSILVQRLCGIEVGELLLEVLVDLVVHLGQPQFRPRDFFQDSPVCHQVFHGCRTCKHHTKPAIHHTRFITDPSPRTASPSIKRSIISITTSQSVHVLHGLTHVLQVLRLLWVELARRHFAGVRLYDPC